MIHSNAWKNQKSKQIILDDTSKLFANIMISDQIQSFHNDMQCKMMLIRSCVDQKLYSDEIRSKWAQNPILSMSKCSNIEHNVLLNQITKFVAYLTKSTKITLIFHKFIKISINIYPMIIIQSNNEWNKNFIFSKVRDELFWMNNDIKFVQIRFRISNELIFGQNWIKILLSYECNDDSSKND